MTRPGGKWQNWSRSARVTPQRIEFPRTVGAVRRAVKAASGRGLGIKAAGANHSFSAIGAPAGVLLELRDLVGLVSVDRVRQRATFRAGTRLHQIPRLLARHRLAMPTLPDIDRQSLAGLIATGSHGTGAGFGGLATQVVGLSLVLADGELLTIDEENNSELLPAAAVGLGALGIVVEVTLQCVPVFLLQAVERTEPLEEVLADLGDRAAMEDHTEITWLPHTARAWTRTLTRLPAGADRQARSAFARWSGDIIGEGVLRRAVCATGRVLPFVVPAMNRATMRARRDQDYADYSARAFTTRRRVRFRQLEYAVAVDKAEEAFVAVHEAIDRLRGTVSSPVLMRFAAADQLWLSPAYGRDTAYLAVSRYWRQDPTELFESVEEVLVELGGRPHWGTTHTLDAAALRGRYDRFDDFLALRDQLDPERVFANDHLRRILGD